MSSKGGIRANLIIKMLLFLLAGDGSLRSVLLRFPKLKILTLGSRISSGRLFWSRKIRTNKKASKTTNQRRKRYKYPKKNSLFSTVISITDPP